MVICVRMNLHSDQNTGYRLFAEHRLPLGLCLGSKSGYARANPRGRFIPNANVFSEDGKLWWGDLDLRLDAEKLEEVARCLGRRLHVVREHDGRFENGDRPVPEVLADAIWHTGGTRLVGWRDYWADSGLTRSEFSRVAVFPVRLFKTPAPPEQALQWERRLTALRALSRKLSTTVGGAQWGAWWLRRPDSECPSPLERLDEARRTKGKFRCTLPADAGVWEWDFWLAWRTIRKRWPW